MNNTIETRLSRLLPVVADSWKQLRACDVFRLLDSLRCSPDERTEAARLIGVYRPDLRNRAFADLAEIFDTQ
jgi:hypothetical protein